MVCALSAGLCREKSCLFISPSLSLSERKEREGEMVTSYLRVDSVAHCVECDRSFDLLDAVDAEEWFYGHDCE